MTHRICAALLCLTLPTAAVAQGSMPVAASTPPSSPAPVVGAPLTSEPPHIAPAGTRVELMVFDEVTTKTAKAGQLFKLKLAQPLVVDARVLLPRGVPAWGEVTMATGNGIAGKSGKLGTKLLYIDVDGHHIGITGTPVNSGQGGTVQVVLATLALTPWGLFAKGNNAKLKAGDIVFAYLAEGYPATATLQTAPAAAPALQP